MEKHYIIESYSGYEAVKKTLNGSKAIWHTTSPFLLEKLPEENENVFSLEEGIDQEEIDNLGKAAHDFSNIFCEWLDKNCTWRDFIDLHLVYGFWLIKCTYVTLYKGYLLEKLLSKLGDIPAPKIICVGDSEQIKLDGLSMNYGRFDTIYAYLASVMKKSNIKVFNYSIPSDTLKKIEENAMLQRSDFMGRVLSLFRNTHSSFIARVWRQLREMRLYPFKYIKLWPWPRRHFYIYENCDLIEEYFLRLLFSGGAIGKINGMPKIDSSIKTYEGLPNSRVIKTYLQESLKHTLKKRNLLINPIYETCIEIISERLLIVLERLRKNIPDLLFSFDKINNSMDSNACILTNTPSTQIDRIFYCYCKSRKRSLVAFEHGVTLGLSETTKWFAKNYGMLAATAGVYHNEIAVNIIEPLSVDQKKFVASLPQITLKVNLKKIQRLLARKWLGIGKDENVIIYIADLDRNNMIYGPYAENDWQYLQKTKSIISYLVESFPQSKIILKLYPTQRYIDSYLFDFIDIKYDNVLIIKDIDFMYIRSLPDFIFVSSSQSTLGWVIGSGVPYLFLDFKASPSILGGVKMKNDFIYDLNEIVMVDEKEILSNAQQDIVNQLFSI